MKAIDIVKQYETDDHAELIVDALIEEGVVMGEAGLWTASSEGGKIRLTLIPC